MNNVCLLLGSNLENRSGMLEKAREELQAKLGRITIMSSVYESDPWGFQAERSFLNQVVRIETNFDPMTVLQEILRIEKALGRKRFDGNGYSSRIIDIDILFFNDEIIEEKDLIIPHPGIPDRMFTLLPLFEIDRSFVHPKIRKTIGELLDECKDKLRVYPYQQS